MLLPDDSRRSAVAVSGDSDLLFWGKAGQPRWKSNKSSKNRLFHRFCRMLEAKTCQHGCIRDYWLTRLNPTREPSVDM